MPISSSYRHCFESASAAAGRQLSDLELERVFDRAQGRIERNMRSGMSAREAAQAAGEQLANEHLAAAAQAKRTALMNLQKRVSLRNEIEKNAATLKGKNGIVKIGKAIGLKIEAVMTPVDGGRFSTIAFGKARGAQYVSAIDHELGTAGLRDAARRGTLDKEIRQEMWEMSNKDAGKPSNVGVSGSKPAQDIATVFRKYLGMNKERLNREGAWIGDLAGYVTKQTHDPIAIFKAGYQTWRDFILPKLSQDTFDGIAPADREKFLKGVWEGLSTGVHLDDSGGVGFKDPAFSGPGNMANRLSAERVLHFNDADSWGAYQDKFGTKGSVLDHVLSSLQRGGQQEALLAHWGTNPKAEFENTIQYFKEKYKSDDPNAAIELKKQEHFLSNLFAQADGSANLVVNQQTAQLSAGARNIVAMAKLGGVAITHFASLFSKAAELRYNGINLLEGYGNILESFLKPFEGAERKEVTALTLAGVEGAHGRLMSPGWIDDSLPGTMSKLTNKYYNLSGLAPLVAAQKGGVGDVLSHDLGRQIGKDFDHLKPQTQRALKLYGIKPEDWDALRNAPDHTIVNGRTYLTPDAAMRSTADMSERERDMLGLKLATYYHDTANRAIITPGATERAWILQGTKRGTAAGEVARFLAQFKMWPVAAVRQGLGRELLGGQTGGQMATGLLHLAVAGLIMGYVRMYLSDTSKGLTPRDPKSPATWAAAMAQSGGLGIFGDFIFGQTNRFGGGLSDTLLGPIIGEDANNLMKIWNDMKAGATGDNSSGQHPFKEAGSTTLKFGLDNTPFINMFYARSALNYLFLNSLQESLNPGFLRRSQQSLQRNTGQTYWLSPQNHLHTFGH